MPVVLLPPALVAVREVLLALVLALVLREGFLPRVVVVVFFAPAALAVPRLVVVLFLVGVSSDFLVAIRLYLFSSSSISLRSPLWARLILRARLRCVKPGG